MPGPVCVFFGITRDNHDGKRVEKLEYEAYEPMVKKEYEKILGNLENKYRYYNYQFIVSEQKQGL